MCGCMVTYIAIIWINRVRLPILHVVSSTEKILFPYPRSRLVIWSCETGLAVLSRVSLVISILRLNLVLTYEKSFPSSAAAPIYLFETTIRHRVNPEFVESRNHVPMALTAESPPAQGQ